MLGKGQKQQLPETDHHGDLPYKPENKDELNEESTGDPNVYDDENSCNTRTSWPRKPRQTTKHFHPSRTF